MKKKIVINILCLILIMGMIPGCGQDPGQGTPGGEAPAVIAVWYSLDGLEEQELLKQFDRITQEYPEVIIRGEKISEAKFVNQVWNLQAGGEGPEIFITSREIIFALYEKGAISPVLADKYAAYPAAKAVFTFNQQPFAAPFLADVPMLYYRKDRVAVPPASLTEITDKKIPIAVKALDTALLSPWWKNEGGSLTLAGEPVLDSAVNTAFLHKLLDLQAERALIFDQSLDKFKQGEVNYLLAWTSDSAALSQAGIDWGSISLSSLLGFNGKAMLAKTIGIANSSIKTLPGLEEPIRLVEEELLKAETQASLHKAGWKMPAADSYYQGIKAGSLDAQAALTLRTAWTLEGYYLDWKLLALQDKGWQNIVQGAKIEEELAKSQQSARILAQSI